MVICPCDIFPFLLIMSGLFEFVEGCREGNKAVGVCLHVYLERDFLSLENIVYPSRHNYERYGRSTNRNPTNSRSGREKRGGSFNPGNPELDFYGDRDWIEGPELEDHCKRLKEVLKCFEEVLITCDSGYDFFRYRHLLYALDRAHSFVCATPHVRKERFLRFLKTIKCAEDARRIEISCHRHNVSSVVWNNILRVEVGDEICDSLSTQRACLLENKYIHKHCNNDTERVKIYEDLSSYFLSVWCKLPIHPRLMNMTMVDEMLMSKSPPVLATRLSVGVILWGLILTFVSSTL